MGKVMKKPDRLVWFLLFCWSVLFLFFVGLAFIISGCNVGGIEAVVPEHLDGVELVTLVSIDEFNGETDIDKVKWFRSGYYNSAGHKVEARTGLIFVQALDFVSRRGAEEDIKRNYPNRRCKSSQWFIKGNCVVTISMDLCGELTKEYFKLLSHIQDYGFEEYWEE